MRLWGTISAFIYLEIHHILWQMHASVLLTIYTWNTQLFRKINHLGCKY